MIFKKKIFKVVVAFFVLFFIIPVSVFAEDDTRVRAYRADSSQSVLDTTWTKIQLNAEDYDTLGEFDSTTNFRFTAAKAGYYQVNGGAFLASPAADSVVYLGIFKNGAAVSFVLYHCAFVYGIRPSLSDILYLTATDYLELWVYHTSGVNKNIAFGSAETFLSIHKLYSMPDIYTQIQNASTDAEFYLEKTINYGDLLIIIFLSIFLIFGIISFLWKFIYSKGKI